MTTAVEEAIIEATTADAECAPAKDEQIPEGPVTSPAVLSRPEAALYARFLSSVDGRAVGIVADVQILRVACVELLTIDRSRENPDFDGIRAIAKVCDTIIGHVANLDMTLKQIARDNPAPTL